MIYINSDQHYRTDTCKIYIQCLKAADIRIFMWCLRESDVDRLFSPDFDTQEEAVKDAKRWADLLHGVEVVDLHPDNPVLKEEAIK